MSFRQLLAYAMFWRRGESDAKELPPSIVLLTRNPHEFDKAELTAAAERGWRRKFDGVEDPMYFVTVSDVLTVIKAGQYVVQLLQLKEPYAPDLEEAAKNLPRAEQKQAWFKHRAWFSVNLWNGLSSSDRKLPKKEAHAVLATLALQLADANCCAIYFPKEGWMIPNNGEAEQELRRLIQSFPLNIKVSN